MARQLVNSILRKKVFVPKPTKKDPEALAKLGRVHAAVFSPDGCSLVGFMIKRPDVAGMIRRPDAFVAREGLVEREGTLQVTDPARTMDEPAIRGLSVNWDSCIMWSGMPARTTTGKDLGFVGDAVFDDQTGYVVAFCVGDGSMAESLVGVVQIPSGMLVGYEKGCMIVEPAAAKLTLTGGVAGKAGEGYAKAKAQGAKAVKRADDVAAEALDAGSKALGRQVGRTKGMFGAFVDEFKKASE